MTDHEIIHAICTESVVQQTKYGMSWSFYEERNLVNGKPLENTVPVVTFSYDPENSEKFKQDEENIAHCGFNIPFSKEYYFTKPGVRTKVLLFSLMRDNLFPKMFEYLKQTKGDVLEVINFYSTGKAAWKQLWMLKDNLESLKECQSAKENRRYKSCPFSSVTVTLQTT